MTPSIVLQSAAAVFAVVFAVSTGFAQDHSHHDHGAVPKMDADGKRLESYQVRHRLDEATLAALREKISLYRVLSKPEVELNMSSMGPNYVWYVSDLGMQGDVGILILAHGVGENSDKMLKSSVEPLAEIYPTAIGYGMAMMTSAHLNAAVRDLKERGVRKVVAVPVAGPTEYNSLTRQWEYIFNMREESSYLSVPAIIESDVEVIITEHYAEHPLITDVLYDHVKEVSENPANEVVIIVGHGPEELDDNELDLQIVQAHADRLTAKNEFAEVKVINLMDDAIPAIRETNVRQLRRWVRTVNRKGQTPVIVPLVSSSHGLQAHIRTDLRGFSYVFADKGMTEHPKYIEWIKLAVEEALAGS